MILRKGQYDFVLRKHRENLVTELNTSDKAEDENNILSVWGKMSKYIFLVISFRAFFQLKLIFSFFAGSHCIQGLAHLAN